MPWEGFPLCSRRMSASCRYLPGLGLVANVMSEGDGCHVAGCSAGCRVADGLCKQGSSAPCGQAAVQPLLQRVTSVMHQPQVTRAPSLLNLCLLLAGREVPGHREGLLRTVGLVKPDSTAFWSALYFPVHASMKGSHRGYRASPHTHSLINTQVNIRCV